MPIRRDFAIFQIEDYTFKLVDRSLRADWNVDTHVGTKIAFGTSKVMLHLRSGRPVLETDGIKAEMMTFNELQQYDQPTTMRPIVKRGNFVRVLFEQVDE